MTMYPRVRPRTTTVASIAPNLLFGLSAPLVVGCAGVLEVVEGPVDVGVADEEVVPAAEVLELELLLVPDAVVNVVPDADPEEDFVVSEEALELVEEDAEIEALELTLELTLELALLLLAAEEVEDWAAELDDSLLTELPPLDLMLCQLPLWSV